MSWFSKNFKSIGNVVGSVVGGILGHNSAKRQSDDTYAINKMQIDAQKEMQERNISWELQQHQYNIAWQMDDLRRSGLNPILAAGNTGSIASAPGGSVSLQTPKQSRAEAMASAAALYRTYAEADSYKKQNEVAIKNADINQQNADSTRAMIDSNILKNSTDNANNSALALSSIAKQKGDLANGTRVADAQIENLKANSEAAILNAQSNWFNAQTNSARAAQEAKESNQRITNLMRQLDKSIVSVSREKNLESMRANNPALFRLAEGLGYLASQFNPFSNVHVGVGSYESSNRSKNESTSSYLGESHNYNHNYKEK